MAAGLLFAIQTLCVVSALGAEPRSYGANSRNVQSGSGAGPVLNSSSVLVGLLESSYTNLVELVEKALLLESLEEEVSRHNVTILAPQNSYLEGRSHEGFRRFLLEPGNIKFLQRLIEFHVIPRRVTAGNWPSNANLRALSSDLLQLWTSGNRLKVGLITVVTPDAVVRHDGVVHGIDAFLVPKTVEEAFLQWKKTDKIITPTRATDLRTSEISEEVARINTIQAAPAPSPGPAYLIHGDVNDDYMESLFSSLFEYGEYSDMAELLANMTSLASELTKLVKEGFRLTILAPSNGAFDDRISEKQIITAPEQTILYHIIPEYHTEDSLYGAVRRSKKVYYQTLRFPFTVVARESDGTVRFGEGNRTAHLYDHDIYTDGLISIQGLDRLLPLPPRMNTRNKISRMMSEQTGDASALRGGGSWMRYSVAKVAVTILVSLFFLTFDN